jgi:predicted metal-dependent peptidase
VAIAQMQQRGSVPQQLLRAVRETHRPQVDWRTELWRFLVRTPDDFSGFDRRHLWQGLYLDALEGDAVSVDVCIDTSGSIGGPLLDAFLGELRGIVRSYPAVRCRLYYADAACHGPFEVQADRAFPKPKGGGGTSFVPFFEAIRTDSGDRFLHRSPHRVAVYLTDGFGAFPKQAPDLDVLWVVSPGGADDGKFPFGRVVRLRGES